MKIAQIVCQFKPYKSGISNMAHDHALGLSKLGHKLTVFTPQYKNSDKFETKKFKVKRLKPILKYGNAGLIPQLMWQLKNFDIVHLHYPFFGGAEVVILKKLLSGKKFKLVVTYHHDLIGSGIFKYVFYLNTKLITPLLLKLADKIIITSTDYVIHSDISNIYTKYKKKFAVIPPSVDLQRFYPSIKDKELLKKYNINPQFDKVMLFVGALDQAHYFKGIDFLISSFHVLDYSGCNDKCGYKVKLIIVGGGNLKEKYEKQVAEMGLADKIKFAGRVSDQNLPKHYNLADLVVLPSIDKSEAFGLNLIEGMACAKPVIASDIPGVRSVFTSGLEGYSFESLNEGDLANRINQLFMDDQLRAKIGQQALDKATKTYNIKKLTKKLEQLYQEIF